MIYELIVIYLGVWLIATLGLHAVSLRLGDARSPAHHTLGVSVIAGALWPLLAVGVIEASTVMAYTKMHAKHESEINTFA